MEHFNVWAKVCGPFSGHLWFFAYARKTLKLKCRGPDSNRHGPLGPTDFKSVVSSYSTTPAANPLINPALEARKH